MGENSAAAIEFAAGRVTAGGEPGVVAAGVYAGGRRVSDISIDEAGDWVRAARPCGVDRASGAAAGTAARVQTQFNLHPLAIEDAGKAHQQPKIEQYGEGACSSSRGRRRSSTVASPSAKRTLRRARLCRLGAPRRIDVLRDGARALRSLPDRAGARRGLHPLCDPRFHRRQLRAGAGERSTPRSRRSRTVSLQPNSRTPMSSVSTCCGAISCGCATRRVPLSRCAGASAHRGRANRPAMQPLFRDVTDHVHRVQEEIDTLREVLAFAFEASLDGQHRRSRRISRAPRRLGRHPRRPDRGRRRLRHELRLHAGAPRFRPRLFRRRSGWRRCGTLFWQFRQHGWL